MKENNTVAEALNICAGIGAVIGVSAFAVCMIGEEILLGFLLLAGCIIEVLFTAGFAEIIRLLQENLNQQKELQLFLRDGNDKKEEEFDASQLPDP